MGVADLYPNEDTPSNTLDRSIAQLAKMSFDEIFDLTAGAHFNLFMTALNSLPGVLASTPQLEETPRGTP